MTSLHVPHSMELCRGGAEQITIKADNSRVSPKLYSLHGTPRTSLGEAEKILNSVVSKGSFAPHFPLRS